MKIIFLDVDGVLNSASFKHTEKSRSEGWPFDSLDPAAIEIMNRVVDRTGARIVVSSDWRTYWPLEQLGEILERQGATFVGSIIGTTPERDANRGAEIQEWLDHNSEAERIGGGALESFAIVDDQPDMGPLADRLVQINSARGLTEEDADRIIQMLEGSTGTATGV